MTCAFCGGFEVNDKKGELAELGQTTTMLCSFVVAKQDRLALLKGLRDKYEQVHGYSGTLFEVPKRREITDYRKELFGRN
jgi:hypothetical protein